MSDLNSRKEFYKRIHAQAEKENSLSPEERANNTKKKILEHKYGGLRKKEILEQEGKEESRDGR